jgi:hypothetical protein
MQTLTRALIVSACAVTSIQTASRAEPVGTAFMYQGQLKAEGFPADGSYDFRFLLFPDPEGQVAVGGALFRDGVPVNNGLFTVELDFDAAVFTGDALWLEVGVREHTQISYTTLSPRQPITAAPYAAYALSGPGSGEFWAANGTHIYNVNTGNVGIGTTEPGATLDVTNPGGHTAVQGASPWIGVYGKHNSTSGSFPGVWGETDSVAANATGLRGYVTSTSPGSGSVGVLGLNKGTGGAGIGVKGQQDGSGWGVYGTTPTGTGVYGNATGTSGTNYGVRGVSASTGGYGGHFRNTSSDGTALYAQSAGSGREDATLQVHNTQTNAGMAAYMTSVGSWATMHVENSGTGEVLWLQRDNSDGPFIVAYNEDLGRWVFSVEPNGHTRVSILEITGGADLSEQFQVSPSKESPKPGMLVCIDPQNTGELTVCSKSHDRTVAGVISGAGGVKPGMLMGQDNSIADGDHPVALTGRVWCWGDATSGAIRAGDLLTTSDAPGHAMKVTNHTEAQGAIVGKAMSSLDEGKGLVLVLVSLQ